MKIVLNTCYGGFSLSWKAVERLQELGHPEALALSPFEKCYSGYLREIPRTDPLLVRVVEELGAEAAGRCAKLTVLETGLEKRIREYDGKEYFAWDDD